MKDYMLLLFTLIASRCFAQEAITVSHVTPMPRFIEIVYFINNDPSPGYNNLTLKDRKTGIRYVLAKLKRGISKAELGEIPVELMIENDASIRKIPLR
ncbi:hypothetical protein [Niabella aurantiaca]|uniref:hypothetical protein n=1 Tax=Niabella aurantiaca TaxID=379900 RepID=UPI00035FFC1E|nr:hypothetical protein [Niabella aurantiaca]